MATVMQGNLEDFIHIIFSVEKKSDEKYKKQKKEEIVNAICALLNSNGGTVEIRGEETEGNLVSTTKLNSLIRTLEQSLINIFGPEETVWNIDFEDNDEKILITVRRSSFLHMINCNLYLPTQTQVVCISKNPLKILNRVFVDQPVELDTHYKTFLKDQKCCLRENKVIQLKHLKSDSSKRVTLADRMIGKSNKFSCYVSAFANHRGGHIYYGIDDDGVVHGEKTENISEVEKKVENAIQNLIWPDVIGRPKRGEHWKMFFEPVLDEKSNPIPSTFVIVIFIAPCFGGVFTEEPESYEMVEGKVERMSFKTSNEKPPPVALNKRENFEVPSTIQRVSLSPATKKRCREVHEILTKLINNGEWELFKSYAKQFLKYKYPNDLDIELVVLSRKVVANYRLGKVRKASTLLTKFQKRLPKAKEYLVFEVLFLFLKAAVARVSGKTVEFSDRLSQALNLADGIDPGICTVSLYLVFASICDSLHDVIVSPDILCINALEHLEYVEDAPVARADKAHNAHITLATYYLGYNLTGKMIKNEIDKESLQKAQASITAVKQSVYPLTEYREIWFTLVQSFLYIRQSQHKPEKQTKFLDDAFQSAKKAENLAKDSGLVEMVCWAQTAIASCTEALLLATLRKMKNVRVFKVKQKVQGQQETGYIATV